MRAATDQIVGGLPRFPLRTSTRIDCAGMKPVRPIKPIRPVRALGRIMLRRAPSFRQLQTWLNFARKVAKRGPASGSQQSATASPDWTGGEETDVAQPPAPGGGHVDKRV